jgi:serine-type D-Ala-D-Ala carboxypeptidase (penicillin-binding protein 5/6)
MTSLLLMSIIPQPTEASISVSAKSAILMEQSSGRILFAKNAHQVRRIASITKIMTAILAIESGKMNEYVTVSSRAVKAEGSSIYLKPGEKIKLEDLVYGLMLRSGNDSAVAIAEHVGGSVEGFVFLMNQKAKEIGMLNSHFANPHGLDDHENHLSTAFDMAILTRYAMMNATYKKIAGTKVHRAPNPTESWDRVWKNKNRLLTEKYKYTTGGKTGYTKRAKRTLVTTATKGDMNLIAVTLDAPSDWNDHIHMYETAFKQYDMAEIIPDGKIKSVKDSIYRNHVFVKKPFDYPLNSNEEGLISINYQMMKPKNNWKEQINIPDVVGQAEISMDGKTIKRIPIYYEHQKVEEESLLKKFKHIFFSVLGVNADG